jgi:hypothetical protein
MAAAISACGGDSQSHPQTRGNVRNTAGAGTAPMENGDAGAEQGGAGPGQVEPSGAGGTAARGGAGGASTVGGTGGAASAGRTSTAGAGPAAGANAGGTPNGGAPSGGAPAGGTPSGGAPSGGISSISGAGGTSAIDPPPGCQAVSQLEATDTCNFEYSCNSQTHFDDCRRDSDGIWSCECGTFATSTRYFEVEGVEAHEACGTIARVCESDFTTSPTRTCRAEERTVGTDTCTAHDTCGHALELDSGLVVRAVDHYRVKCGPGWNSYFSNDTTFGCTCQGGAFNNTNYLVSAPALDGVCAPMIDFCTAETDPVYSGGLVCGWGAPQGTVLQSCPGKPSCQGCLMPQDCGGSAPVAQGVAILNADGNPDQNVVCRPQSGSLHCDCEVNPDDLYGDDTVPQATLDLCAGAKAVCAQ